MLPSVAPGTEHVGSRFHICALINIYLPPATLRPEHIGPKDDCLVYWTRLPSRGCLIFVDLHLGGVFEHAEYFYVCACISRMSIDLP